MKTALLHYWLTNMRGGEKVLAALADMLPGADIFTHALSREMRDDAAAGAPVWHGHPVRESLIARLPLGRRIPQAYLPLMPLASRALALDGYELIVSSESGPIKGIAKPRGARHVCYCHTPMRYVWDMYDYYYSEAGVAGKAAMRCFRSFLRREDLKSAETVDQFIANSRFVAERIRRIYGRDAVVVHPPVDVKFFMSVEPATERDYYLFAGAPVKYKRLDLAKAACARLGRRLIVAGGRENPVTGEELRRLYAGAKALLFPGIEDFGIVPVEAQAAGTPVIAFGEGGALETVVDGLTGLFFREPTVEKLCSAIEEFESREWSANACRANSQKFTPEKFTNGIQHVLGKF